MTIYEVRALQEKIIRIEKELNALKNYLDSLLTTTANTTYSGSTETHTDSIEFITIE